MKAWWRCEIMGMADKVSGEESRGRAWWRRYGTTGMDTAAEEMRYGNRKDVVQQIWKNVLEEQQWTEQMSTGNNYQSEGVSSLR